MTASVPSLTIQLAVLYASGDDSTFVGTGGPAAYDPFLGAFSDIVSSRGILAEPFNDRLMGIQAGDQLVFCIAVQNFGNGAPAYDVKLRNLLPYGFVLSPSGADIAVTDGAGTPLNWYGNLFDAGGSLIISDPLAAYSDTAGTNVALVTFSVQASANLAVPLANLSDQAQIIGFAATSGGPNLIGSNAGAAVATVPLQTDAIRVGAVADQPAATLASGQTASYDITVTLAEGTTRDLRIDEVLPFSGNAGLSLVSAQIVSFGAHLSASQPVAVQPGGSIALGTVIDTPDGMQTADDQIVVRVTVATGGSRSGTGTLNTVVSAADPNSATARWSTTVSNTLPLAKPDTPPTIAGISPSQTITNTSQVLPFAGLILSDPDVGQTQTLTIHRADPTLGTFGGPGLAVAPSGDGVLQGSVAAVQAAARQLVFTPAAGAAGTERFTLTLDDGASGTEINAQTALTITPAATTTDQAHYAISAQTVLTSTVTGSTTVVPIESYVGPLDEIQNQFFYDGAVPLAIVALQDNLFVGSKAQATAVQLHGGVNLVDMRQGSAFLVSGTGSDTFIFHADQPQTTWNTIVNFHAGDTAMLYGFKTGVSTRSWDPSAGAPGYTGVTLRTDLNSDGLIDSSLTFTGKSMADVAHFAVQTGSVGGNDYLLITAT